MGSLEYNARIKNVSIVCAVLVVCIHLPVPESHNGVSYSCWSGIQSVASVAVPFFFLFSGYFLSAHFDEGGWWWREFKKRIHTILVPSIIWSCFVLINLECTRLFQSALLGVQADYNMDALKWFGLDLTSMPGAFPLWFLRNLILLVVTSAFIKRYIDSFRWLGVLALYILYLCYLIKGSRSMFLDYGYSLVGLLYFSAGVACRRARTLTIGNVVETASMFISLIFLVSAWVLGFEEVRGVWLHISIPFMMIALWRCISGREWNRALVSFAFPIYVMHIIVQPHAYSVVKYLHIPYLLAFACQWLLCIVLPVMFAILCRRFLPSGAKLLFGGR